MTEISFYFNVPSRDRLCLPAAAACAAPGHGARRDRPGRRAAPRSTASSGPSPAPEFLAHAWIERAADVPASLHATTIWLGENPIAAPRHDALLNLGRETPPAFETFERVFEIVSIDDADRQARARALEGVRAPRLSDQAARGGGMSTGRPPPGTIPTLTEVVAWPGAGAGRGTARGGAACRPEPHAKCAATPPRRPRPIGAACRRPSRRPPPRQRRQLHPRRPSRRPRSRRGARCHGRTGGTRGAPRSASPAASPSPNAAAAAIAAPPTAPPAPTASPASTPSASPAADQGSGRPSACTRRRTRADGSATRPVRRCFGTTGPLPAPAASPPTAAAPAAPAPAASACSGDPALPACGGAVARRQHRRPSRPLPRLRPRPLSAARRHRSRLRPPGRRPRPNRRPHRAKSSSRSASSPTCSARSS